MRSNRRQVEAELRTLLRRKNSAAGLIVQNEAKRRCPVDSGRLRASVTHDADEAGAVVGTNVEYAPYVELGTRYQDPQPFLVPALDAVRGELRRLYGETSR